MALQRVSCTRDKPSKGTSCYSWCFGHKCLRRTPDPWWAGLGWRHPSCSLGIALRLPGEAGPGKTKTDSFFFWLLGLVWNITVWYLSFLAGEITCHKQKVKFTAFYHWARMWFVCPSAEPCNVTCHLQGEYHQTFKCMSIYCGL